MPKGITTVSFCGGPNDGEVIEDFPGVRIIPKVCLPSGSVLTEEPDGVGVYINVVELPCNWFMYRSAVYVKREPVHGQIGVFYDFQEKNLVERCRALTKTKDWCKNEAVSGKSVCTTHSRASNVELKPEI